MLTSLAWTFSLGFFLSTMVSQSLMDFFSTCLVGLTVFISLKEKVNPFKLFSSKVWIFLIAWFLWVACGLFLNQVELTSAAITLSEFKWILTLVSLVFLMKRLMPNFENDIQFEQFLRKFYGVFVSGFLVTSAFAVSVYFLGYNPARPGKVLDTFPDGTVRTGGFLSQPIVFGHLEAIFLVFFCAVFILNFKNLKNKFFWGGALSIGFLALVLSFTRGAWIGFAAALALIFWFKSKRAFFLSGITSLALVLSAYSFWPDFKSRIDYAFQGGDQERVYIWKANLEMFFENPWVGVGYSQNDNNIVEYFKKIGAPDGLLVSHAHNQFLHFLAGTGVIGLGFYLIFIFFWVSFILGAIRSANRHPLVYASLVGCLASMVTLVFGGLTESNFEHSKIKYALVCVWALALILSSFVSNSSECKVSKEPRLI